MRNAQKCAIIRINQHLEFCGDRPHEILIFQCFPDIDPATALILAAFAGFLPGGDPLNEFIFGSFFEMWYDVSVDAGSVGRKDYKWIGFAQG